MDKNIPPKDREICRGVKHLAVASLCRQMKWCAAQTLCGIYISPIVQQQSRRFLVIPKGCVMQWGHQEAVTLLQGSAVQDQQLHHSSRAATGSQVERRGQATIGVVHLGTPRQQLLKDLEAVEKERSKRQGGERERE